MDEKILEGLDGWGLFWAVFGLFFFVMIGQLGGVLFIYIAEKLFSLNRERQVILSMLLFGLGFVFGVGLFYNVFCNTY